MFKIDRLLFVVVSRGGANTILNKARECGATGGTIFLGEGIVSSRWLEIFGQNVVHQEILMISSSDNLCDLIHETIDKEFSFSNKNRGMAFSVPFKRYHLQASNQEPKNFSKDTDKDKCNAKGNANKTNFAHFCIITIVDKGQGRACIKAARAAGARGGTLIRGRGAGIPADFYFPLVIEPQKDVVIIISSKNKVPHIKKKIYTDLHLEKVGTGIIFTLPIIRITGFSDNAPVKKVGRERR